MRLEVMNICARKIKFFVFLKCEKVMLVFGVLLCPTKCEALGRGGWDNGTRRITLPHETLFCRGSCKLLTSGRSTDRGRHVNNFVEGEFSIMISRIGHQ